MKNCEEMDLKDLKEIPSWEFKKDFEKSCIQNILAKVTSIAMLMDSNDVNDKEMDIIERCTTLAITLTDQIKYLNSETTDASELDNKE